MLYAITNQGKQRAAPGASGQCPNCKTELVPRCGSINIWHWAHLPEESCDPWSSNETAWHLYWKSLVPPEWTEVSIKRYGSKHIADILRPDGLVIELQHSSISPGEIIEREAFYGQMLWLFDVRATRESWKYLGHDATTNEPVFSKRLSLRKKDRYHTFRWKHPRKHIALTTKRTFLDLGPDGVFFLKKMYPRSPCGGWGYLWNKQKFIDRLTRSIQ